MRERVRARQSDHEWRKGRGSEREKIPGRLRTVSTESAAGPERKPWDHDLRQNQTQLTEPPRCPLNTNISDLPFGAGLFPSHMPTR